MMLNSLAGELLLGHLLQRLRDEFGTYELLDHWTVGEYHHDILIRIDQDGAQLPGNVMVVSTNCNGGLKALMCFAEPPSRDALWRLRCGEPKPSDEEPLATARTLHWFDPTALIEESAA